MHRETHAEAERGVPRVGERDLLARLRLRRPTVGSLQPVRVGVPLPRGRLRPSEPVGVWGPGATAIPAQWRVAATWRDGTVRWGLLDLMLPPALASGALDLRRAESESAAPSLEVEEDARRVVVDVSACRWVFEPRGIRAAPSGRASGEVELTGSYSDLAGIVHSVVWDRFVVEARGPVRATLLGSGTVGKGRRSRRLRVQGRFSVYAETGLLKAELTLHNPRAAVHRGGLWDLGDPGSVRFRGYDVRLSVAGLDRPELEWSLEPHQAIERAVRGPVEIYQASSGGEHWSHRNHVNRDGVVPLPFRGYAATTPGGEVSGLRASPVVSLRSHALRVSATIEKPWQQFPKAMEADSGGIRLGLFPARHPDPHELQGGEQKTHAVFVEVDSASEDGGAAPLEWVHAPARISPLPEHLERSGALEYVFREEDSEDDDCRRLLQSCVEGGQSFFAKREVIDEYGWRHFGEVYADHENAYCEGPRPIVSHYNNQYDLVRGFLLRHASTGDDRWLELADDLARHVIDIDIYHTREDKAAYNGGLFWHTDHYVDAHRSTHRTYSQDGPRARSGQPYGGGPSNEHNYARGLLYYHYMTGSEGARDAVLELAQWVLDMDDGRQTILGSLDPGPTGVASSTYSIAYHGPGRGGGNSIRTLLAAYDLTEDRRCLAKAEELIARCIHPRDDVAARDLGNPEARWSYLVFLEVVGEYLDLKSERDERDGAFDYARASLDAYARWMLDHEVPYRTVLDRVEYPTETWPAHDMRKSAVLAFAAKYGSPELRERYLEKSAFFRDEAVRGVASFETRHCTRPLAVLLQSCPLPRHLRYRPLAPEPSPFPAADFGRPTRFQPQKERVRSRLRSVRGALGLLASLLRPDVFVPLARDGVRLALRRRLS